LSADAQLAAFKNAIAGRYLVDAEVGRGGMAVVYLAREVRLGRRVAVKVLAPAGASSSAAAAFFREIKHTVRLEHPNILPISDAGEAEGLPFLVTRYVRDGSLRRQLGERRLSLSDAVAIVQQTAAALQFAHDHEILHCDVKPENILLQGDHVYLADFGISRAVRADGFAWDESAAGVSPGGTASYVSPEQALGERALDGRTDLYSLACVAYEMLAGRPPFTGRTDRDVLARRFTSPALDPPHLARIVPTSLRHEIGRALSLDVRHRHRTVAEFAAALDKCSPQGASRRKAQSLSRVRRAFGKVAGLLRPRSSSFTTATFPTH